MPARLSRECLGSPRGAPLTLSCDPASATKATLGAQELLGVLAEPDVPMRGAYGGG